MYILKLQRKYFKKFKNRKRRVIKYLQMQFYQINCAYI